MCAGCNGPHLGGPSITKQGVLSVSTKEDGTGAKAAIDGDTNSPQVGEQSYTQAPSTAAPVTKNNGNL